MRSPEPSVDLPPAEVVIDRLPGRVLSREQVTFRVRSLAVARLCYFL